MHRISRVSNEDDGGGMLNDHMNNIPTTDTCTTAIGSGTRTEAVKSTYDPYHRTTWQKFWENKALMVDLISRVFFPMSFAIFNAFYWGMYAVSVDDIIS